MVLDMPMASISVPLNSRSKITLSNSHRSCQQRLRKPRDTVCHIKSPKAFPTSLFRRCKPKILRLHLQHHCTFIGHQTARTDTLLTGLSRTKEHVQRSLLESRSPKSQSTGRRSDTPISAVSTLRGILKAIVPLTAKNTCSLRCESCETVQGLLSSQALVCVDSCTFCQGLRRLLFVTSCVGRKESRDVQRVVGFGKLRYEEY